jgi:hypothetical protein
LNKKVILLQPAKSYRVLQTVLQSNKSFFNQKSSFLLQSTLSSSWLERWHTQLASPPPEHPQINTRKQNKNKNKKSNNISIPDFPVYTTRQTSFIHSGLNQKSRKKKLAFRSEEKLGKKGFR